MAQRTGREDITLQESNQIWDRIIDPPSRNRRYGYDNQEVNCFNNLYLNLI